MNNINIQDVVETKFGTGIVLGMDSNTNTYDIKIGENVINMSNTYVKGVVGNSSDCGYEVSDGVKEYIGKQ